MSKINIFVCYYFSFGWKICIISRNFFLLVSLTSICLFWGYFNMPINILYLGSLNRCPSRLKFIEPYFPTITAHNQMCTYGFSFFSEVWYAIVWAFIFLILGPIYYFTVNCPFNNKLTFYLNSILSQPCQPFSFSFTFSPSEVFTRPNTIDMHL